MLDELGFSGALLFLEELVLDHGLHFCHWFDGGVFDFQELEEEEALLGFDEFAYLPCGFEGEGGFNDFGFPAGVIGSKPADVAAFVAAGAVMGVFGC